MKRAVLHLYKGGLQELVIRRTKCEVSDQGDSLGDLTCRSCLENDLRCTFTAPVRKRGPQPGSRKRTHVSTSPHSSYTPHPHSHPLPQLSRSEDQEEASPPVRRQKLSSSSNAVAASVSQARSQRFGGVPSSLVDQLLPLYFTHVHNVWPLIYKPTFNPHTTSLPLLLSMLAIASCINPPHSTNDFPTDRLYRMAEQAVHEARSECRIDLIQSLILLSLRQTGCGDKQSAALLAGQASSMALIMGLNLAPATNLGMSTTATASTAIDVVEREIRSRVYWNTYVLDKTLAEETGRPFVLTYRRSTTPLPSTDELEELETWPPPSISTTSSAQYSGLISPRRGYVMSCFNWTCRLGMIVEDVLNLETQCPPSADPWDIGFLQKTSTQWNTSRNADAVAEQLENWRRSLPSVLSSDQSPAVSPLPHHAVTHAWYHSTRILLNSRFIRRARRSSQSSLTSSESTRSAHQICSEAAQASIDILSHLDRFQLLSVASSDLLHMLSLTALFEAFDTTNPDHNIAHKAKVNFAQCCIWLRDFSKSWPAASSHRVFFEGLIQGGLRISTNDPSRATSRPEAKKMGNSSNTPTLTDNDDPSSPSIPDGLRAVRRHLSISEVAAPTPSATASSMSTEDQASLVSPVTTMSNDPTINPASLFQLPQVYWNHLHSTSGTGTTGTSGTTWNSDFDLGDIDNLVQGGWDPSSNSTSHLVTDMQNDWLSSSGNLDPTATGTDEPNAASAGVQSALMSFIMHAARDAG
ncbi:hypothetical protein CI109_100050 [Kwoniella shandongensis]|uniref:Xylanolytic transcriptional activator regulatory domain-containing protein n=1 Tax=Kwoniella shandongensis TaxID=1734106 RepID=A0AAJ8LAY3_9TREE